MSANNNTNSSYPYLSDVLKAQEKNLIPAFPDVYYERAKKILFFGLPAFSSFLGLGLLYSGNILLAVGISGLVSTISFATKSVINAKKAKRFYVTYREELITDPNGLKKHINSKNPFASLMKNTLDSNETSPQPVQPAQPLPAETVPVPFPPVLKEKDETPTIIIKDDPLPLPRRRRAAAMHENE